ncbi:MAG TPA: RNA polymerase subunit sigma [Gordonia polyisoprenivorans]|uniref:sigma-70 family RNA polymerase sigma factor n=1 Tax=Gordonia TaxID=2053 RepID=UPI00037BAC04|nr:MULTISPECIES: sigma-70 family RNA polymerase sigma factor [Gordonia]MBE7192333.1 sigma-70 family RNA polymerase sigma factor [Gordonia polyisoprenivorans]OPX13922.1 RNA polymerase subunit sigma [Gordonia sp. i37]OZC31636.1 RNA polymerase subunit sigma [Gordonia polyisoprenivorans]UZF54998.1 sigma-70 family RNA polymerase sigma factor [Gordonia polyisoprenivorans]HCS56760.1 RNA polymerase subunit sigma [Gordonia polyisoprenivorans]
MDVCPDDELTRAALRAATGDRAALTAFIRATQKDVWRFIAHLGHASTADDLTQETYLRAMKSISRFRAEASAKTWLLSIARRVCADEVRHDRSRPRVSPGVDWISAAEARTSRPRWEDMVEVNLLLEDLPAERREALVLTQILGLSYQEAAEVTSTPIGTIRSRVARAREYLIAASTPHRRSV